MAGTIRDEKYMSLRKFIGTCDADEHGELSMNIHMDGTPCIESKSTGQTWTIGWQELIHMAIEAGVAVKHAATTQTDDNNHKESQT